MTKEELKQEAEVYADNKKHFDGQAQLYIVDGYLAGAEPREKRIAELENGNKVLAQNLEDSEIIIAELEAQIEKVKHYLDYDIPHDLINEATTKIWRMLK